MNTQETQKHKLKIISSNRKISMKMHKLKIKVQYCKSTQLKRGLKRGYYSESQMLKKRQHKFKSNVTDNISLSLMSIIQYKKLEKLFLWVQTVQTYLVKLLRISKGKPLSDITSEVVFAR